MFIRQSFVCSWLIYYLIIICCLQEKPFRCPLCDRCFGQQTNLDRHLKKHESDGPQILDDATSRGHHHHAGHRDLDLDLSRMRATRLPRLNVENDTARYFSEIRRLVGQACGGATTGRLGPTLPGGGYPANGATSSYDSLLGRCPPAGLFSPVDRRLATSTWLTSRSEEGVKPDELQQTGDRSAYNSEVEDDDEIDNELDSTADWNASPRRHCRPASRREDRDWASTSSPTQSDANHQDGDVATSPQKPNSTLIQTAANCGVTAASSSSSSSKRQRLHDLLALATAAGTTTSSRAAAADRCSSPDSAAAPANSSSGATGSLVHQLPCVYWLHIVYLFSNWVSPTLQAAVVNAVRDCNLFSFWFKLRLLSSLIVRRQDSMLFNRRNESVYLKWDDVNVQ